jgi:hypothetical protein
MSFLYTIRVRVLRPTRTHFDLANIVATDDQEAASVAAAIARDEMNVSLAGATYGIASKRPITDC